MRRPRLSSPNDQAAGASGFISSLEGLRACAAYGVVVTHVAFQTGSAGSSVMGRIWGRFDMAVAVFFALSGFLLWRPWARKAWSDAGYNPSDRPVKRPAIGRYLRSRFVRIFPAYWATVIAVLVLLPDARGGSIWVWIANLTMTQVFIPLTLTSGLTQMWSLGVEVSFYLVLPVLGVAMIRIRGVRRVYLLLSLAVVSLSWGWLTPHFNLVPGINANNWLPGHIPWFVGGLMLAEFVTAPDDVFSRVRRFSRRRFVMAGLAVLCFAALVTPAGGPPGLLDPSPWQYACKMGIGGVLAYALLAPLVLGGYQYRFLDSMPMQALGRWSYSIFNWHLLVLAAVFPLFGILAFHKQMVTVLVATAVLSAGVAAVSYALIEEPCRVALQRWEAQAPERAAQRNIERERLARMQQRKAESRAGAATRSRNKKAKTPVR